jgi:hypothetical protein
MVIAKVWEWKFEGTGADQRAVLQLEGRVAESVLEELVLTGVDRRTGLRFQRRVVGQVEREQRFVARDEPARFLDERLVDRCGVLARRAGPVPEL